MSTNPYAFHIHVAQTLLDQIDEKGIKNLTCAEASEALALLRHEQGFFAKELQISNNKELKQILKSIILAQFSIIKDTPSCGLECNHE